MSAVSRCLGQEKGVPWKREKLSAIGVISAYNPADENAVDIAFRIESGECGITGATSITIKSILLNTSFLINRIGFMSLLLYGGGRG